MSPDRARILVVEDDDDSFETASDFLSSEGHNPDFANLVFILLLEAKFAIFLVV